ncbi:MAG TPA: hypothetical protein VIP28_08010 [Nocardioides sp.]
MATPQQVEPHQRNIRDLTTLAIRDLVQYFRTLDPDDLAGMQRSLSEALPELVATYGTAAASLAADWYDELRDAAGPSGRTFRAVPAELPDIGRTDALAGWATSTTDRGLVLSRLSGGLQRIVANADRGTVEGSVRSDPADARWARHASANACAFCALLATRGAVYHSEKSAGLGAKYHDHCHCVAVPVWGAEEYEPPDYVATWTRAYKETGSTQTATALSGMRQILGTN